MKDIKHDDIMKNMYVCTNKYYVHIVQQIISYKTQTFEFSGEWKTCNKRIKL